MSNTKTNKTNVSDGKGKSFKPRRNKRSTKTKDDRAMKLEKQEAAQDYNNNPSFYFKDKDLMEQVTSLSFTQFLEADGKPFNSSSKFEKLGVPGIMNLYFNPSPGFTRGNNTADGGINIAAMKLYTKLSSMNAKTTQYAPQDVATLMLALGEVVSTYEWIRRVFRSVFLYNKRNWNMPKMLITSMHVDFDDLVSKLADYRLEFNSVVNMINQISFPGDLEYFAKCATMYSHIYSDSESPMSQLYLFHPATTWIVDETSFDEGTILSTQSFLLDKTNGGLIEEEGHLAVKPLSHYISILQDMIQAILNSATYNYIYADVLRLVDPGKLLTMPYVIEGDGIAPEFDPMMNVVINNATIVPAPITGAAAEGVTPWNDVYPKVDNNAIFYAPFFPKDWSTSSDSVKQILGETIINFPHSMGNPDVDQRVEATRFITLVDGDDTTTSDVALPDHYCVMVAIVKGHSALDPKSFVCDYFKSNTSYSYEIVAFISQFDYAPRLYRVTAEQGASVKDIVASFGDLDYFTSIKLEYLKKVNDLAYVNLFSPDSLLSIK